jgi:hypothetical protein
MSFKEPQALVKIARQACEKIRCTGISQGSGGIDRRADMFGRMGKRLNQRCKVIVPGLDVQWIGREA